MSSFLDKSPQNAVIVAINFNRNPDFTEDVEESVALAESAGFNVVQVLTANRDKPDSTLFIGKGKAEEINSVCTALNPQVVIFGHNITPVQERNLDKLFQRRIIDRTQLILDIFAQRVTTNEGILQVELAQQSHLATRLVRRWTHLERQRGGIGLRSGSGEKQIELDKRAISDKVAILKKRLAVIVKQRETQRKSRLRNNIATVSIVGYTNAGKSTLFNSLTKAKVYAEDRLFATLQTTSRHLFLSENHEIVLSDTVGFIRNLPHQLVAAFRATLEETVYANLLLHVVDVASTTKDRQIEDVNEVLSEIKAETIPQLVIYNKIDLVENITPRIVYDQMGEPQAVYISAEKMQGLDLLRQAIKEKLELITARGLIVRQEFHYEPWKLK